jgi:hypothetical protein
LIPDHKISAKVKTRDLESVFEENGVFQHSLKALIEYKYKLCNNKIGMNIAPLPVCYVE